jgi:hypothetical protein
MNDIESALESLPNNVIDDVVVQGNFGFEADHVYINVTFVGDNVQGPQNLLSVEAALCGDGCSPKLTGFDLAPTTQNTSTVQLSDFNSFECGRRGKCDYTSGICTCFTGYTGLSCNVITALV